MMLGHSWAIGVHGAEVNKLPAWRVGDRGFESRSGIQQPFKFQRDQTGFPQRSENEIP